MYIKHIADLPFDGFEVADDEEMDVNDFVTTQRQHIVAGESLSPHGMWVHFTQLLVTQQQTHCNRTSITSSINCFNSFIYYNVTVIFSEKDFINLLLLF